MQRKVLAGLGSLYVVLGLLLIRGLIERYVLQNSHVEGGLFNWALWGSGAFFISFGVLTLLMLKAEFVAKLNLMVVSFLIMSPILGEGFIRIGIGFKIEKFRSPQRYADYFSEDDYWKLEQDWVAKWRFASPKRVHSLLGWSQSEVSPLNPLGLEKKSLERIKSANPKIPFYGDSFVKGSSDVAFEIPEYMHHKMNGMDVVDLGVAGCGVDQIYLMFNETYQQIPDTKLSIVGILTKDLDRTVLSVRTSQKPYFLLNDEGQIQLQGVPIQSDQGKYFEDYKLNFKSYLWALLKRKFDKGDSKRSLKQAINSQLLDRFKEQFEAAHLPWFVVVFYGHAELNQVEWRESFLKEALNQKGIRYVDTKELILDYAKRHGVELSELYSEDGHHNDLGNQVVAEGILAFIADHQLARF